MPEDLISADSVSLDRLNETMWSFYPSGESVAQEVRIITPSFKDRSLDYQLARLAANFINKQNQLPPGLNLSDEKVEGIASDLRKSWQFTDVTEKWSKGCQADNIVSRTLTTLHTFKNLPYKVIEIKPVTWSDTLSWNASRAFSWLKTWVVSEKAYVEHPEPLKATCTLEGSKTSFLLNGAFTDPFTQLATAALKRDETSFISERDFAGSYRFAWDKKNAELRLEPISVKPLQPASGEEDPAIAAVIAYRDFLKVTYGWRILDAIKFENEIRHYGDIFTNRSNEEEQLFGYLKSTFGIDFGEMIRLKQPLLPDHIFKCNIAVGNIEMPQVESLYLRIVKRLKVLPEHIPDMERRFPADTQLNSPKAFVNFFQEFTSFLLDPLSRNDLGKNGLFLNLFSLREIRGLYKAFNQFAKGDLTVGRFCAFLDSFDKYIDGYQNPGYGEKIRELEPEAFHRLMEILYVDTHLLKSQQPKQSDSFFTGRKITHLGISGYKTMGDRNTYDPSRNLFELLHVYPGLVEADTDDRLNELLSMVVAKKALWSQYPLRPIEKLSLPASAQQQDVRRVGRVIPFPAKDGEPRYYFVDGLLNDGGGDLNYVLVPACKGYMETKGEDPRTGKRAPLVKLYRSTASDAEAESGVDTLLADTNPEKVGSLDFSLGDEYETIYFNRCTMPIWAAYLLTKDTVHDIPKAKKLFNEEKFKEVPFQPQLGSLEKRKQIMQDFLAWQIQTLHLADTDTAKQEASTRIKAFIAQIGEEKFNNYLTQTLEGREWINDKMAQDIHFVGHSLGGALSQSGMSHFGPEARRIALASCNFKCFTFDSPGVTLNEARKFVQFGRDHRAILAQFGQKWEIHHRFEQGDLVPLGGECLLGAQDKEFSDTDWLTVTGEVRIPKDTARDIVITTNPTHGRRFLQAKAGKDKDYTVEPLTMSELFQLKRGWTLGDELRRKLNYNRLETTFSSDTLVRRGLPGTFAYGVFKVKKFFSSQPKKHELDKNGVLYCTYKGYTASPA